MVLSRFIRHLVALKLTWVQMKPEILSYYLPRLEIVDSDVEELPEELEVGVLFERLMERSKSTILAVILTAWKKKLYQLPGEQRVMLYRGIRRPLLIEIFLLVM